MNEKIEKKFIKNFIMKNFRGRLEFELGSEKNRMHGIFRFSHEAEKYLDPKKISKSSPDLTEPEIERILLGNGCKMGDEVYLISTGEHDGKMLPLERALKICLDDYCASIIVCGENLAFLKAETEFGSPEKYILHSGLI